MRIHPFAAALIAALALTGCTASPTTDAAPAPEPATVALSHIAGDDVLDEPTGIALRPGTDELWITNRATDAITIIDLSGTIPTRVLQDGYGEHFTALPSGIAFSDDGAYFAVSNDSNNEVRDIDFQLNPERNTHFKGNNFMGPSLFSAETFAIAGQNKAYSEDWPQPGISHDPPDDTPQHACPEEYWSEATGRCVWPRQGSHLDMLHGDPLSTGIVHDAVNAYYLLDGCGRHDVDEQCTGPGHVTHVDFNRDHQEGNGFHGDGTTKRYIDLPYERVEGLPSGMFAHDDWIYYADTGAGVVRRFQPDSGRSVVMVSNWNGSDASHGEHGPGVIDWSHLEHGPGDGDDPETVKAWVAEFGDAHEIHLAGEHWIPPMETLAEYSYVWDAVREDASTAAELSRPTGLTAGAESWFVADAANGMIHEFGWDGEARRVFDTGLEGLAGLAIAADDSTIYVVDSALNAVFALALD